jgi:hypothetical protein
MKKTIIMALMVSVLMLSLGIGSAMAAPHSGGWLGFSFGTPYGNSWNNGYGYGYSPSYGWNNYGYQPYYGYNYDDNSGAYTYSYNSPNDWDYSYDY